MVILPPWAYAAGAALIAASSFGAGWQVNQWRHDAQEKRELERAIKHSDAAASDYAQSQAITQREVITLPAQIRTIYRDREVPADCEPPADARCVLDNALGHACEPAPALP